MSFTVPHIVTMLRRTQEFTATELDRILDRFFSESGESSTMRLIQELLRNDRISVFQAKLLSDGVNLFFGDYQIVAFFGEGVTGRVFRARDVTTGQIVALRLFDDKLFDEDLNSRFFEQYVEPALYVSHQNIAKQLDVGIRFGKRFAATEFVEGTSLSAQIGKEGGTPVERALFCVRHIAAALAHAHECDLFHGSISPRNLYTDSSDRPIIIDFGIGVLRTRQLLGHNHAEKQTSAEAFDYVAPEQFGDPQRVDERVDIYALGCTLHYLLTGKPVYGGRTMADKQRGHCEEESPDLKLQRDDVPIELNSLFQRMIARRPKRRIQSMYDVVDEIDRILESSQVVHPPAPESHQAPRRPRNGRRSSWQTAFGAIKGSWLFIILTVSFITGIVAIDWLMRNSVVDQESVEPRESDSDVVAENLDLAPPSNIDDTDAPVVPDSAGLEVVDAPAASSSDFVPPSVEALHFAIEKRQGVVNQADLVSPYVGTISRVGEGDVVISEDEPIAAASSEIERLLRFVEQGQRIKVMTLDLSQTAVENVDLELVSRLDDLICLSLHQCANVNDEGMRHLRDLANLETLDLRGTFVTTSGLHNLPSSPLRSIMLDAVHDQMGGDLITTLASRYDESLTALRIDRVVLDEHEFRSIARLKNLRDLSLTFVDVPSPWLEYISTLQELTTLDLTGNAAIDDLSLTHFQAIERLQRLTLNQTSVKDQGRFESALACTIVWE